MSVNYIFSESDTPLGHEYLEELMGDYSYEPDPITETLGENHSVSHFTFDGTTTLKEWKTFKKQRKERMVNRSNEIFELSEENDYMDLSTYDEPDEYESFKQTLESKQWISDSILNEFPKLEELYDVPDCTKVWKSECPHNAPDIKKEFSKSYHEQRSQELQRDIYMGIWRRLQKDVTTRFSISFGFIQWDTLVSTFKNCDPIIRRRKDGKCIIAGFKQKKRVIRFLFTRPKHSHLINFFPWKKIVEVEYGMKNKEILKYKLLLKEIDIEYTPFTKEMKVKGRYVRQYFDTNAMSWFDDM